MVSLILTAGISVGSSGGGGAELKLPSYAYTNPIILNAYKYATQHPEILEQIPCYCGCGSHGSQASDYKPHRFLRECYITDNWAYDEHASFCDVCVGEATKVQDYLTQGKTLKEVRELIEQEYGKTGGMMTNTPPVRDDYISILKPKLAGMTVTPAPTLTTTVTATETPTETVTLTETVTPTPTVTVTVTSTLTIPEPTSADTVIPTQTSVNMTKNQSENCFWCWAGDEFGKDAGNFIKNGVKGLWKVFTGG
jgi:hypothetical protein